MAEPAFKLLLVDDDPHLLRMLEFALKSKGYEVITARDGDEALDRYRETRPDLVVLDVMLPKRDGMQVCREMRQIGRRVPILLLTALDDSPHKVEGFDVGADDYITKPFDLQELLARIHAHLRRASEEHALNPLSGLPANGPIQARIESVIRGRFRAAVLYADLDHFKSYNDVYGFSAGDRVILYTASVLQDVLRQYGNEHDFIGHLGGDDFVLLTTPDKMETIAHAVIERFESGISAYYLPEDIDKGGITTPDRQGHLRRFPIMTISLAAVVMEPGAFDSILAVAEVAAEMKRVAKQDPTHFAVDRRRYSPKS